jgi:hypothetical protein
VAVPTTSNGLSTRDAPIRSDGMPREPGTRVRRALARRWRASRNVDLRVLADLLDAPDREIKKDATGPGFGARIGGAEGI